MLSPTAPQQTSGGSVHISPLSTASSQTLQETMQQRADRLGVPFLESVDPTKMNKEVLAMIPEDAAGKYRMFAFESSEGILKVAMEDPSNIEALNVLQFLSKKRNLQYQPYLVPTEVVDVVLSKYSTTESALQSAIETFGPESENAQFSAEETLASLETYQDAPVAKLVETTVQYAIDGKASDIHIEPVDAQYRIRFRVDGVLHSSLVLPKQVGKAVVARIKILSNLKIDEKRKPQDGRFRMDRGGSSVDFRVSALPVIEGEKIVMRVLDKKSGLIDLPSLGLMGQNYEIFDQKIREPFGIILMTGPTGSGKSTTLYGFLKILNMEQTNIITLEDPVEYFIEGINQSQVKPEIGYTFASGLRSILRQDPNIIMVGEIRDSETAELAIHAALTGHLVFSTLHTNSALGAVPRLLDMGIESFLLSASIRVLAAQRLVRRICDHCKEKSNVPSAVIQKLEKFVDTIPDKERKKYGVPEEHPISFYHGKGCGSCNNSGYKGRVALYEVAHVSSAMQNIIAEQAQDMSEKLEAQALKEGMMTLRQDGILKALLGFTTLDEVERVTEGGIVLDEE